MPTDSQIPETGRSLSVATGSAPSSFTERQKAEFWEKGWKRLLHRAWQILGVQHPLSSRIGNRFLRAGGRSVDARAAEKSGARYPDGKLVCECPSPWHPDPSVQNKEATNDHD